MKSKLLFVLLWLCAIGVSAQHLTVKNYQKKVPSKIYMVEVEVGSGLYWDCEYIQNIDWLEYLYWLEQIYGKESAEYRAALPDEQILQQQFPENIARVYKNHPMYADLPVLGVSPEQARAYCEWRTDRVAEQMLVSLGKIKYDPNQTPENYFSVKKGMMPADLKLLYFFLPGDNIETRYGFSCFAEWR